MSGYFETAALAGQIGFASALLSIAAYLPYIRDVLQNRTRPQRASWLIWSVLGCIAFAAQWAEGATHSLWFVGSQVAGTIAVFALSLVKGQGRYLSRTDMGVLSLAVAGLFLWHITQEPAAALAIVIAVSALGGALTVAKCLKDPGSETVSTWGLSWLAAGLGLVALEQWEPILLAYPLYLMTLYSCFMAAIWAGRLRDRALVPVAVRVQPTILHPSLPVLAPPLPEKRRFF